MSAVYRCKSCHLIVARESEKSVPPCPYCGSKKWSVVTKAKPAVLKPTGGKERSDTGQATKVQTAIVLPPILTAIVSDAVRYLLEERKLTALEVNAYADQLLRGPEHYSRSLDDAIRLSLQMLERLKPVLSLTDAIDITRQLSGEDGAIGARVRKGGCRRGDDTRKELTKRTKEMQSLADASAQKNPKWPFRKIAEQVGRQLEVHERTVRKRIRNPRQSNLRGATS